MLLIGTHEIKQRWPEIVKTDFKFVGFYLSVALLIWCENLPYPPPPPPHRPINM